MNTHQKEQIERYRQSGVSFAQIAEMMNLPISTVKSYCYRNPVTIYLPQVVATSQRHETTHCLGSLNKRIIGFTASTVYLSHLPGFW